MSARNGDKSRFGRQRKQKIRRRVELRALRPQKAEAGAPAAGNGDAAAAEHSEAPAADAHGTVLQGAARVIGSTLGTIAVETHLAPPPSEHQE